MKIICVASATADKCLLNDSVVADATKNFNFLFRALKDTAKFKMSLTRPKNYFEIASNHEITQNHTNLLISFVFFCVVSWLISKHRTM